MNQLTMDFASTRARAVDPETSKAAAKAAITDAACGMRLLILCSLREHGNQTPKEIAARHDVDFIVLSRRMSEVGCIARTTEPPRAGSAVWAALPWKEIQ